MRTGLSREGWTAAGVLAGGTVAAVLLRTFLPLPADDPFRGTLALLPLLLAAFYELRRWVERRGGRPLAAAGNIAEVAALAALVLLTLARSALAVPRADEVLAAGFLLVLGSRIARQTVAARPLLGEVVPRCPSAVFFLLPLLAYLAILPWSAGHRQPDGDEPYYLLITHSLAYDFDADLANNYAAGDWRHYMDHPIAPQPGDPVGPHGERYSRHNELLPLVLAPAYRLAGKTGALVTMAVLTAILAWLTLRLAHCYALDRPGESLAAWALVAFAPPLLLYSYQVWAEVPAGLLAAAALDRILTLDGQRRWGWREWVGLGIPVLLLPLLKLRFILLSVPLLVLGWWHAGRPRKPVLILGLLLATVAGGLLLYNELLYANPLKIHSLQEVDPYRYSPASYLTGGLGLFWDAAFGLFACAPLWLLLLAAVPLLAVRRERLLFHLAALSVPYFVVLAPRSEWYGGWSPPFRYAMLALPLLGLALVPLLARRARPVIHPLAWALLAGLGALTLVLTLVWVVVPGWTYNFADGRSYALDALSGRLGLDFARLFPSSIRPRPATWLWPLATAVLVPLLWWLPGRSARTKTVAGLAGMAALAGIAAVLLAAAVLPAAAARLPTRVIELEDPQVSKSGGHLYPETWMLDRVRYRGSWVLRVGEWLQTPVVPGGRRVRLTLHAQLIRNQPVPFALDVLAGDRLLATWKPGRERVWEAVELGPFDWPAGQPLTLAAHGPHPPGALNGVLLDCVDLDWL